MKSLTDILKNHLVDVVGGVSAGNPIYAVLETQVARIPIQKSINSKYSWFCLALIGAGSLYTKGRDYTMSKCKITNDSSLVYRLAHDAVYGPLFSLPSSLIMYVLAGTEWEDIKASTWVNMKFALPVGIACGISIDIFRDLMGTKECKYLPNFIKNQKPRVKKTLGALYAAGSVAATMAFYDYIR